MVKLPIAYENNPLLVAIKGIELLFAKAVSVAILFLILIGVGFLFNAPSMFAPSDKTQSTAANSRAFEQQIMAIPTEAWIVIGIITLFVLLVFIFIQIILSGISDYTAAKLSKNEEVTLGEALSGVFSHFWGYTWVLIIVSVKTLLWSLLFIVPGIIMAVRYSLSGVSYFDKQLAGNTAVTHSLGLTKGAWLTTFASHTLLPIVTFGVLQNLTSPGTTAVLYRQYTANHGAKPSAHVVSWLTLILPLVLISLVLLFALLLVVMFPSMTTAP